MGQRILFDNRTTTSHLRNGLIKTAGVELVDLRFPSLEKPAEENGVIQIQAVNSRQRNAKGYVEIPYQQSVLQALADHFQQLAHEAGGSDINAQAHALQAVVDHQLDEQSMAHEDLVDMLDEMMYQLVGDVVASEINNQGIEEQLKVIVSHGWNETFRDKLVTEGIFNRDVIDPIYENAYQRSKTP